MHAPKKRTAEDLVTHQPGAASRRRELIIALCRGGVGMISHYNADPKQYAAFIVKIANHIIESTE